MNNEIFFFTFMGFFIVILIIHGIFQMKYKKEMFIEFLKHDDSSYLSDEVIKKIFDIGDK